MPAMHVLVFSCVLLLCILQVNAVSLKGCTKGRIDVANNTEASVTCEFTDTSDTISWSIVKGGSIENIGNCSACVNQSCPCDSANDYNISRTEPDAVGGISTVTFSAQVDDFVNATITCSNGTVADTCDLRVVGGYRLSDCFVVEGSSESLHCNDIESEYGVNWTISYDDSGTFTDVAHCEPCNDVTCPPCDVTDSDFNVTRSQTLSSMQLLNVRDATKENARVRCFRSDRNDISGICQMKLFYYRIPQCQDGQIEISEIESPPLIQCTGLRLQQQMNWTLTDSLGQTSQIAFCSNRNCTAENNSDVMVDRDNQVSNLTFGDNVREIGNMTLTCIRRSATANDSCLIRTIYPAELGNISLHVDSNLTVTGRVHVTKVFASDDNVTCGWFYNVTGQNLSSTPNLSTFTDQNRLDYQQGVCDVSVSVNSSELTHTLTVWIQPGNDTATATASLRIERPGQNLITTCSEYIAEGADLNCRCSHQIDQWGNPPATISWNSNTDSDVDNATDLDVLTTSQPDVLHVANVSRKDNGTAFVCVSVWAGKDQTNENFTMLVAFGPDKVTLNGSVRYIPNDLDNVTLTCEGVGFFPAVSVQWSVPCLTLSSDNSTCVMNASLAAEVSTVTCTAFNTKSPELNESAVFTFYRVEAPSQFPFAAVGAGVGAAVLVIIIVVIIVVICKCRGAKKTRKENTGTNSANDDSLEIVNETYGGSTDRMALQTNNSASSKAATKSATQKKTHNGLEFEEHINEFYQSADQADTAFTDGTKRQDARIRPQASSQLQSVGREQLQGSGSEGPSATLISLQKDTKQDKEEQKSKAAQEKEEKKKRKAEEKAKQEKERAMEEEEKKRQKAAEKEAKQKQEALEKDEKRRAEQRKEEEKREKEKDEREQKEKAEREKAQKDREKAREKEEQIRQQIAEEEAKKEQDALRIEEKKRADLQKAREEEEKRKKAEEEKAKREREKTQEKEEKKRQQAEDMKAKQTQEALEKEEKRKAEERKEEQKKQKAREEEKEKKEKAERERAEREKQKAEDEEEKKRRQAELLIVKRMQEAWEKERKKREEERKEAKRLQKQQEREAIARMTEEEKEAKRREKQLKKEAIEKMTEEEKEAKRREKELKREAKEKEREEREAMRRERQLKKEVKERMTEEEKEARRREKQLKKEAKEARRRERQLRKEAMERLTEEEKEKEKEAKRRERQLKKDAIQRMTEEEKEAKRRELQLKKEAKEKKRAEKEARRRERQLRKEALARLTEEEKEARRRKRQLEKEAREKETEEEKEARRRLKRLKMEAKAKARGERRKAKEEQRKAKEEQRKAKEAEKKAREEERKVKALAAKKEQEQKQRQGRTKTGKGVILTGFGPVQNNGNTTDGEFEEHINDLYESADALEDPTKTTSNSADDEFEEHVNDLYESADAFDNPGKSTKTTSSKTKPDDEFEEHINDLYESADNVDFPQPPTKANATNRNTGASDDGRYAVDGNIYHELESDSDDYTSESETDSEIDEYEDDSDIYDSIDDSTTDYSSSDSDTDNSSDDEFEEILNEIYESADDIRDVKPSDVTPAKAGQDDITTPLHKNSPLMENTAVPFLQTKQGNSPTHDDIYDEATSLTSPQKEAKQDPASPTPRFISTPPLSPSQKDGKEKFPVGDQLYEEAKSLPSPQRNEKQNFPSTTPQSKNTPPVSPTQKEGRAIPGSTPLSKTTPPVSPTQKEGRGIPGSTPLFKTTPPVSPTQKEGRGIPGSTPLLKTTPPVSPTDKDRQRFPGVGAVTGDANAPSSPREGYRNTKDTFPGILSQPPKGGIPLSNQNGGANKSSSSPQSPNGKPIGLVKPEQPRIDVRAAKAFLDSQAHMYSQVDWHKKKNQPHILEDGEEPKTADQPQRAGTRRREEPEGQESRVAQRSNQQAKGMPSESKKPAVAQKGSVMKKTPPAVPMKPKGKNWKPSEQGQAGVATAPQEVYPDSLSQSQKTDAVTAAMGKQASPSADKTASPQGQESKSKARRSELYVNVTPVQQPSKVTKKW